MKEQIKELRVRIDGLSQLVMGLCPDNNGGVSYFNHETRECYDSLILAKAWLGKVLGELGEESPYKAGKKTIEDIEPTADTFKGNVHYDTIPGTTVKWFNVSPYDLENTHIEKVDWLREEIKNLIDDDFRRLGRTIMPENQDGLVGESSELSRKVQVADIRYDSWSSLNNSYNHLSEARFWLGFELQRIKEEK